MPKDMHNEGERAIPHRVDAPDPTPETDDLAEGGQTGPEPDQGVHDLHNEHLH